MKLTFVLAESALEMVPEEAWSHPSVRADSRRRGVEPEGILLDRSVHHAAMLRLKGPEKRGRPDLVHEAVLSVTGTPLYQEGGVKLWIHTCRDFVLEVEERTRVPKSYFRFRGLVEQALRGSGTGKFLRARKMGVRDLVQLLSADRVYALTIQGRGTNAEEVGREVAALKSPAVLVGGFPRGHFSSETLSVAEQIVRIHPKPLEAHVVAARLVYEVEKASGTSKE